MLCSTQHSKNKFNFIAGKVFNLKEIVHRSNFQANKIALTFNHNEI